MAFPVIKVDSTAGAASDTACSGAGPSTALSGTTNASTSGTGLVVTLPAGTDLTNVAVDGSHVIFINDSTAGARNFGKITAQSGSGGATPTVTVSDAFGLNLTTKSWAVGGVRATVAGTNSLKLFSNNSAAGDAMPGWAVEMQSGHTESISTPIDLRRAGDTTSGPIIFRGVAGAATLPKLTATSAINMVVFRGLYQIVRGMELTAGAASMTSAITDTSGSCVIDGIKLSRTSTNTFTAGFSSTATGGMKVVNCEIQRCTKGIVASDGNTILNNYIHDCTSHGIDFGANSLGGKASGNVIAYCGGDGINSAFTATSNRTLEISHNTIHGSTSNGINLTGAVGDGYGNLRIYNNLLTKNGVSGLYFSNASVNDAYLATLAPFVSGNATFGNTTAAYRSASGSYAYNAAAWATGDNNIDPSGGLASASTDYAGVTGGSNFAIASALKATAYPVGGTLAIGSTGSTYSYVDPGAAQRQEPNNPIVSRATISRGQQSY